MAKYKKGTTAIFLSEASAIKAAYKTKEMGYTKFDAINPYPVHGMEEACGIKSSWIPFVTFITAVIGLGGGVLLTWWTSAVNWDLNVVESSFSRPFYSSYI